MTAYRDIPNSEVAVGAPITNTLMTALRDNPLGIQEGDVSAASQRMQTGAYADLSVTSAKLAAGVFTEDKLAAPLGVWVELSSQVPSSQYTSFIDGTGGVIIDSTYDMYRLVFGDINTFSGGTIMFQVGTSGGFITTTTYNTDGTAGGSYIALASPSGGSAYRASGTIEFNNPSTATATFFDISVAYRGSANTLVSNRYWARNDTTTAIDRVRIGNTAAVAIENGWIRLFGMNT